VTRRDFVKARKEDWNRFERLLVRYDRKSSATMSQERAEEFSRLFRLVANDLAVVRAQNWSGQLSEYLNGLVARAHNAFYTAPPGRFSDLVHFLLVGYPRVFRRHIGYFAAASGLFFVPFVVTLLLVLHDPTVATRILPREQLIMMENMYNEDPDAENREFDEQRAMMAGFYVQHNVGIALKAFGVGILFAVPTISVLLYNGIVLGASIGYTLASGPTQAKAISTFVIGHGAFELTAIAVAGGAGLMLGDAILHRGRRSLAESLATKGIDAVKIASGAAAMLVIAALIEAFWSPSPVPSAVKYVVGAGLWVVVVLYLALAGRGADDELEA
jgi:uncharacterized membrane protein SpoIIM required for sporulation